VDELLEPELNGLWDDGRVAPKTQRGKAGRELSTLEQRYMAAARVRRDSLYLH